MKKTREEIREFDKKVKTYHMAATKTKMKTKHENENKEETKRG
jgi:hypothetical protein